MRVENGVITITKDELLKVQDRWLSFTRAENREVYDLDLPDFIEWVANQEPR